MTSTGLTGVHKSTAIIRAAALLLCLTIVLIHPPSIITAAPSDAAAQAIVKLRAIWIVSGRLLCPSTAPPIRFHCKRLNRI
jgi:hypothetical protein